MTAQALARLYRRIRDCRKVALSRSKGKGRFHLMNRFLTCDPFRVNVSRCSWNHSTKPLSMKASVSPGVTDDVSDEADSTL
ncbi:hypothetical protein J6590_033000 [Homalodisca vitripennis]|nr:hypothetical protein J6590_033000 [Homalodisca vitripennis]